MQDKRMFPRFDSTLQIKYSPETNDKQFSYTLSSDISKGGLRMPALSGIVNKGDLIKLDIAQPYSKDRILAKGKVKWIKPINRIAPLDEEMGIEFVDANPADIDILIKSSHRPMLI